MKLHKTIELDTNKFRFLKFEEKYFEKFADYKFTGADYYINFELLISQNFDNNIKIFFDDSQDSKEAIPFISEGIENFFSFLNSKNINLSNGLNFTITNTKNHPVDFKPRVFIEFTYKRLKKIFFDLSEKEIEKPILDFTNSINQNIQIISEIPKECHNLSNYQMRSNIDLPIIYNNELAFSKIKLRKVFSDFDEKFQIELILNPNYRKDRIQYLSILSPFSKESVEIYVSTKETFELIIKEIYEKKYNLSGIDIYINILNYDSAYSKYAIIDFKYDLYYFIKEFLLRNNEISKL